MTPAAALRRSRLRAALRRAEARLAAALGVLPAARCWCGGPTSWDRRARAVACLADPGHDPRGRAETLARLVARVGPTLSPDRQASRVLASAALARRGPGPVDRDGP